MSGTPTDVGGEPAVRPETPAASETADQPEIVKTEDKGTEADTPEETPEQADERERKKRDGGWQRKIKRLEADGHRLQAERDAALAEAKAARQPQAQKSEDDDLKPPRLEEHKSYEEYETAREAYVAEKTRRATLKELKAEQQKATDSARRDTEAKRFADARASLEKEAEAVAEHYEDFDDAMEDFWKGRLTVASKNDAIAQYLVEDGERRAELIYHLWANPEVGEKIGALSPLKQIRELARLEASLPKPEAKTATKAPAPPNKVGARGGPDGKDPSKMSIDEMRKATGTHRIVDY